MSNQRASSPLHHQTLAPDSASSALYDRSTTQDYGFTALPADASKTPPVTTSPPTVSVDELKIPTSPLARRINAYAEAKLPRQTYHHSLRVYAYGLAAARGCFPDWKVEAGSSLEETWFLTAMLHDIGTPEEVLMSTRLSYEFYAGVHALDILRDAKLTLHHTAGVGSGGDASEAVAGQEQAESVAEAIIRHQDVQDKGKVTLVTRLVHIGTLLDNIGAGKELVSEGTVKSVVGKWPREGWTGCFRGTVELEKKHKPYAMVSRIEGFEETISKNTAKGGPFEWLE
ncbi:uncharacterized protein HMPREF1541_08736 [Cyphellophora europaea CBS 101466]|uniref:HD/PDEase domain-containing protein n=1 Tax=Cyphellophora europaea (strain CBS 101466) TaxID=1220924 RepID=W2RL81_CYPE1|nr:uncharacterized protein HMPREF1541_08736 [Cyphellophora europaea CBS 101466]ETN36458.1 hypothetical protein HMPREF1541_08736 [Cyphellophora europaea CBS 101466]